MRGAQNRRPDLRWQLDLVGNRYAGADELGQEVTATCKSHPEIRWHGIVDDAALVDLYRRADFTVYPSLIEGFGIPIVESLAFGKPCICADTGVMAELAAAGGCLTVDVRSSEALSGAIELLIADDQRLRQLSEQARARPVRTWEDYAFDLARILTRHEARHDAAPAEADASMPPFDLDRALYPRCLCQNWQMNHSERMALRGLLDHVRPRCAVEVGTFWGGSLSLIAQYAAVVFSIDINPLPPSVRVFPNVSYLTGPSERLLPVLLDELRREQLDPQLILIDGDHSQAGVARDLDIVLGRPTRCPLWIVMHDSINPGCRAGMLDADWAANRQVHFVDLDFVPGRLVEHGGGGSGELWGGLGLACLLPQHRQGDMQVVQSAENMRTTLLLSQADLALRDVAA